MWTTFRDLANKFQRTGNVCDEKRSARSTTSQETEEIIWQAIEQSPKASTHRLSREYGIPKSTVWQTLRFVQNKRAIISGWWASSNSAFAVFFFFLKQQSRQHRAWTCLSNSCSCLSTTFWIWWCFSRTAPYRILCTLCIITSTRHSQDAGLDKAHHGSGQQGRVI